MSVQKVTLEEGKEKPTELKLDTILSLDNLMSPTEENISMFCRDLDEVKTDVEKEDSLQQPEFSVDDKEDEFLEMYQGEVAIFVHLDVVLFLSLFD